MISFIPFRKITIHFAMIMVFVLLNMILYYGGIATYNKENMGVQDLIHYTVVTHHTVGYGDIYPENGVAKILSWLQMFAFAIVLLE